jgi:hypothetical protein
MTTKHVHGFKRGDGEVRVSVIVDADALGNPFPAAQAIAGPDYCFHATDTIHHPVPDAVKYRLLTNAELYAAVPEMNPQRRARR